MAEMPTSSRADGRRLSKSALDREEEDVNGVSDEASDQRRAEYIRLKCSDCAEFIENWNDEKAKFGGRVPARMIAMTGIIMRDLEEFGAITGDPIDGYAPTEKCYAFAKRKRSE